MFGGALNKHWIVLKRENQLSAQIGVEQLLRQEFNSLHLSLEMTGAVGEDEQGLIFDFCLLTASGAGTTSGTEDALVRVLTYQRGIYFGQVTQTDLLDVNKVSRA